MPNEQQSFEPEPAKPAGSEPPPRPRIYRSHELFEGSKEIWIEHGADLYRLRITAQGKLVLTK